MLETAGYVGILSHLLAFLGYLALAGFMVWRRERTGPGVALILAALLTAAWAAAVAFAIRFGGDYPRMVSITETLKTAGWVAFMITLLSRSWRLAERVSFSFLFAIGLGFVFASQVLIDLLIWFVPHLLPETAAPLLSQLFLFGRLIGAIGALVLVENVYRNAIPDDRWGIRMLSIALVGMFGYDIYLYTDAMLFGGNADLFAARGAITLVLAPLIMISVQRSRQWRLQMQLSRQVVFHSISLVTVGVYLLVMSITAYGLRLIGGDWGRLLQVGFLFSALLAAFVIFVSGRFRAWLRVKINKHFFAYKYDYREEWLRLINTVSRPDLTRPEPDAGALETRVIRATCDILDSPGGVLWLPSDDGAFAASFRWNYRTAALGASEPFGSALVRFLGQRQRIVNFDDLKRSQGDYDDLTTPAWAVEDPSAWLAIPLIHIERLIGFVVIERSRAARTLNWEDFDLLKTVGRQAASYIAEAQSQVALVEANQFEDFNRRFAFIIHDIKNLVSQLSLVSRNAQKFAGNQAFQADMLLTIQDSVEKMNTMLARLQQHNLAKPALGPVLLPPLMQALVASRVTSYPSLTFSHQGELVTVQADEGQLEQVFSHLIQNAIDASADGSPILVRLAQEGDAARVEIIDQGLGMSEEFVRNSLFKPFKSTKSGGFGIGAYEAREIIRALGGRLDVRSEPGKGSTFAILLPLLTTQPA